MGDYKPCDASFATLNGFEGTDTEWAEEFESLCEEWQCSPLEGFTETVFRRLVNDDSEKGCACSNEELQRIFDQLSSGMPNHLTTPAPSAVDANVGDKRPR